MHKKCTRLHINTQVHKQKMGGGGNVITRTTGTESRDCEAKGNGQFVKSGESGEADSTVGLETMAEIKARLAEGGDLRLHPEWLRR